MIISVIIGFSVMLFIPCLIVGFWKKRPRIAFILGMLVMFLTIISPSFIKTFLAMFVYGEGDPQLMAGQLSEAIVMGLVGLVILGPILFLFQWFVLRRHRRKFVEIDTDKTFS